MTDTTHAARVWLDARRERGPLDRRLFGSFVEHLGRCVYTGIYEPGHPAADEHGFRRDVEELVDELGVTLVRYPGGNFVSGYRWEDGIGPREQRPKRLEPAGHSLETNEVGVDEFARWCKLTGSELMMAVNLGTRGMEAALDLLEYVNHPGGTHLSDLRVANGREASYDVRLWCLGNEMDGPWQVGAKTATEYGRLAAEAGKAMKLVDPTIELVACGSSNHTMPTFGYWESEVLEHAWEVVDHISMHAYYEEVDGDRRSFLASGTDMDSFIDGVAATIDAVTARKHSSKRIGIAFDEWNVWYQTRFNDEGLPRITEAGRLLEDDYSALDAVVVGDLLISLLNHADRVRIACLAQLLNVSATIRTEPGGAAWRQPTFHPFAAVIAAARGVVLATEVDCATVSTERYGDVPTVTAAAALDPETGAWSVFLTNRSGSATEVHLEQRGLTVTREPSARSLTADTPPGSDRLFTATDVSPGPRDTLSVVLPAESWTVLELS
jgi:alpha-N-arabinofuranosidase